MGYTLTPKGRLEPLSSWWWTVGSEMMGKMLRQEKKALGWVDVDSDPAQVLS